MMLLHGFLVIAYLLFVSVVASPFAWEAPKRTAIRVDAHNQATVTSQPPAPTVFARDDYASVPANICGWIEHDEFIDSWDLGPTQTTCYWNTDMKAVGPPFYTTCLSTCSGSCPANALICTEPGSSRCTTEAYHVDTSTFFLYNCAATATSVNLVATYLDMTKPILFPRFVGNRGISFGTQYPPGWTISHSTASGGANNTSKTGPASLPTSETASQTAGGSSLDIRSIVGGVVGGVVALCATAIVIALLLRKKRTSQEKVPTVDVRTSTPPNPPTNITAEVDGKVNEVRWHELPTRMEHD